MARIILVHGGCHGSWCWDRVIQPLTETGHDIEVPDLPGRRGDRSRLSVLTLDDSVSYLATALDAGPTPAVVVAHSMAGITVSQLAERKPEAISHIIYVAAVVPGDGRSGLQTVQTLCPESLLFSPGAMVLGENMTVVEIGQEWLRPAFYHLTSETDFAWARERTCADAAAPLTTPVALTSQRFGSIPKTYVVTAHDRVVHAAAQRAMARQAHADIQEITSDHSPFFSAPHALVSAIDAASCDSRPTQRPSK